TNGGSSSVTFCMPSVTVVLLSHHLQLLQPYSAVDTGTTFFSLPSFIFTFLPPSLSKPGTSAGAGGGRLNVWFTIKSREDNGAILRARISPGELPSGPEPLLGSFNFVDAVRVALSSSYCPVQWTTAPTSNPCIHVSAGPS